MASHVIRRHLHTSSHISHYLHICTGVQHEFPSELALSLQATRQQSQPFTPEPMRCEPIQPSKHANHLTMHHANHPTSSTTINQHQHQHQHHSTSSNQLHHSTSMSPTHPSPQPFHGSRYISVTRDAERSPVRQTASPLRLGSGPAEPPSTPQMPRRQQQFLGRLGG